jgi:hypothetical protein
MFNPRSNTMTEMETLTPTQKALVESIDVLPPKLQVAALLRILGKGLMALPALYPEPDTLHENLALIGSLMTEASKLIEGPAPAQGALQ